MGKKIIFFILLFSLSFSAEAFGRITEISGTVSISRNLEYFQPITASRIYAKDLIILEENAFVRIETPRRIWQIEGPALVEATENERFEERYGSLTWRRHSSGRKSLPLATGTTFLFPGIGHWYIEDYFKAVPMLAVTTGLLWNIFSNNPQLSNHPETVSETRQIFQQIYLVYLIVAIMDVWSETNSYNNQIYYNPASEE